MTAASPAFTSPFPGIRPFKQEESDLFFGRETQTDELLRRLGRTCFVAVVGSSGSGKSSLVRAGLLPALVGGFLAGAVSHWRLAVFRPGADPIGRLRDALQAAFPAASTSEEERFRLDMLETSLRRSSLGLVETARQARLAPYENLLVVVDQFEELFRFGRISVSQGDDQAAFVRLLLEAIGQREIPIHVLVTMRSDFLGDCAQFRDLPETINEGLYLIPRMTRDQLGKAITGPAGVAGIGMTPRLVQQLLNDLCDEPYQLPILQHALMRMWDRMSQMRDKDKNNLIDLGDYEAIGRMAEALSRHANESWDKLPDENSKELARRMFQCLTARGPNNGEVRRPTTLGQMCGILETDLKTLEGIVNYFRVEGRAFLTPLGQTPVNHDSVIDISHESLIRKWEKLQQWAEEEAECASEYRRLAEAARLNRAGKQGLWSSPALDVALNWKQKANSNQAWAERYAAGFQLAMDFLDRSVEEQKARVEREAKALRTEKMRKKLTFLTILLIAASAVFLLLYIDNQKLLKETRANRVAVKAALLASQDDAALTESVLMAAESMRFSPSPDSDDVLRSGLALLPRQVFSLKYNAKVNSVAFSPDGRFLATGSADGTARVLDSVTGREISQLAHVLGVVFSPDGRFVATASDDGTARVMEASAGKEISHLTHQGSVLAVVFSPDGSLLEMGSADGTARLVQVATGREVRRIKYRGGVKAVLFSPNGRFLATASDKTARLIDATTGREVFPVVHDGEVQALAFSPQGHFLATGSEDKTARVIEVATGKQVSRINHQDMVNSVAFSPDEQFLATGSKDQTARVSLAATGREIARLKHQGSVNVVTFSHNGSLVATASNDHTARVMEALTGHEVSRLPHDESVLAVAFSPDDRYLATGSLDQTARLFEAAPGKDMFHIPPFDHASAVALSKGHSDPVYAVAFSKDERYVATGSKHTARVLDRATGREALSIEHTGSVYAVAFSSSGRYLASGDAEGKAWVTEIATKRQVARLSHQGHVNALSFSPDERYIARAGEDKKTEKKPGFVELVEIKSERTIWNFAHQDEVTAVAFSPDGHFLAIGSRDKTATVLKADTGKLVSSYPHQGAVVAVAFDPDGKYLATGSDDNTARVMEVSSGREISRLKHRDWVYGVAFSPDGNYLATASKDKTAFVIERATGKKLSRILHDDSVLGVAFSQDGRSVQTFAGDVFSRHFVRPEDLIKQACSRLPRNMTHEEWDEYFTTHDRWYEYFAKISYRKTCPNLPVP